MRYEGYHELDTLPIKKGQTVTIRKGVMVQSTKPGRTKPAGRTYTVIVDHVLEGASDTRYEQAGDLKITEIRIPKHNPQVRWVGTGGYWHSADINDIPEAVGV